MSETDELPEWTCEGCGTHLRALTASQLQHKRRSHAADCDADTQAPAEPATDSQYTLALTPPRDIEAYAVTEHFYHMLVRREDPAPSRAIVETTLAEGRIEATAVDGRFIFAHRQDGWPWRVIVKIRDEAFLEADSEHLLLTVYSPASKAHREVSKYV